MRILFQITGILFVGIFVAYWRGTSLLDPLFFIPFACLPVILAGPVLVRRRRQHPEEPELTQLWRAAVQSCVVVYLILAVSLVMVNLTPGRCAPLVPSWSLAVAAVVLGAGCTTVAAALTIYGLRRFSGPAMKWISRGIFLAAVVLYHTMPGLVDFAAERITIWGVIPATLSLAGVAALLAGSLVVRLRLPSIEETRPADRRLPRIPVPSSCWTGTRSKRMPSPPDLPE